MLNYPYAHYLVCYKLCLCLLLLSNVKVFNQYKLLISQLLYYCRFRWDIVVKMVVIYSDFLMLIFCVQFIVYRSQVSLIYKMHIVACAIIYMFMYTYTYIVYICILCFCIKSSSSFFFFFWHYLFLLPVMFGLTFVYIVSVVLLYMYVTLSIRRK